MATANPLGYVDDEGQLRDKFLGLARQLEAYCRQGGCPQIRATHNSSLPYFSNLEPAKKRAVIEALLVYLQTCEITMAECGRLTDSRKLIWFGLRQLGLTFDSELFDSFTDEHTIEVYDANNVQIFRNFKFMEKVSYSIEDIYCRPWMELFHRDNPEDLADVIAILGKVFACELTGIIPMPIGAHRIRETQSPFKNVIDLTPKFVSPIFEKSKIPCGYISIEMSSLVSTKATSPELAEQLLTDHYAARLTPELR